MRKRRRRLTWASSRGIRTLSNCLTAVRLGRRLARLIRRPIFFVPGTNGDIAPNDCVKWGPGLTSAGAACNSVTGGAHPANQLSIYTNHDGLVNNVTTPTEAWTVQQQGFYAPGDGGAATYQWNFTSYCPLGTSGLRRRWTVSFAFCRLAKASLRLGGMCCKIPAPSTCVKLG